ncbi:MAG TPA: S41 family peptidase [Acidisarcina sp.]
MRKPSLAIRFALTVLLPLLACKPASAADTESTRRGYYRHPAVHGDTIVFTAEGDLWTVPVTGGLAHRLTSNPGTETNAFISPDGRSVGFSGEYEGPTEVYTMPLEGGLPERRTWDGDAVPAGWTPDGRVVVRTYRYSTLPDAKLVAIDNHGTREMVPLAQAAEASYSPDGKTLFFTRFQKQPSFTKRYKGGGAENIWRYDAGSAEAIELTGDYLGTSHDPMYSDGRVYFLSDRDGVMNVYSMTPEGKDLKPESHQRGFDVKWASVSGGRIVYSCGADLWLLDLRSGQEAVIPIALASDFDQLREHWVKKPLDYLTGVHLSPDGGSAVFTARGEVFTLPAKTGRIVRVAGNSEVRYREARFLPDGKSIVALSTESGETEFWKYPANGEGPPEQWTHDATVLRWVGIPSPDGRWLAHRDKDQQLWVFDIKAKKEKKIAQSMQGDFIDLRWSPDSRWLAFGETAKNQFQQINVLNIESGSIQPITSDHYNSWNAAWSADGKWLYFLSDRSLKTTVESPWGTRQPDPNFNHSAMVYELALLPGLRSPFAPVDELHPDGPADEEKKEEKKVEEKKAADAGKDAAKDAKKDSAKKDDPSEAKKEDKKPPPEVKIDFTDLASRLSEVPAPPGNYDNLQMTEKRLCWLNATDDNPRKQNLQCLDIANKGDEVDTLMPDVKGYEVSLDGRKTLIGKGDSFFILDSDTKGAALGDQKVLQKATINLSRWTISTNPREEFHQLFLDAWRLERDYFYDRNMQGVNWVGMRDRYLPLVDRVADRNELNDVISQMVSELSALHTFVEGGDSRKPADEIDLASLGAQLRRDEKAGGYVVEHIYLHDPDLPHDAPPLARPDSLVHEGEVIVSIDGVDLLSVPDERALLRGKADVQVLLRVKAADGKMRDVLVTPIKADDEYKTRYTEWEYSRKLKVEADGGGQIGYVHLQAMTAEDIEQWAREFYPVFKRQGLIIDVRHNKGGNIDSWLLSKLLRKAWFYWQPRVGDPYWNMQYAFRGHMVVLCDQQTGSDGEAFSEGFKRFELGKVIGMRTWGGEIWLSGSNVQSDNGIATAAEMGVYGPEGKWLIEGHGVDPDIEVDDLPHATFTGSDAQLQSAVDLLKRAIQEDPRPVPHAPAYPRKDFPYAR